MVRARLIGYFSAVLFFSCTTKEEPLNRIFLGGQIINPSSRTVTLYQGNTVVETFQLDDQLRFKKNTIL